MQKANVLISKSDSRMKNAGTKKAPFQGLCGVPGATRTPGLPLRRRSLYPTELREHGLWGVAQGECTSSALGGDRSILLSYGNITYFILDRPFYISKTRVPNRVPNLDLMSATVCAACKKPHSTGFFRCIPWHLEDIAFP